YSEPMNRRSPSSPLEPLMVSFFTFAAPPAIVADACLNVNGVAAPVPKDAVASDSEVARDLPTSDVESVTSPPASMASSQSVTFMPTKLNGCTVPATSGLPTCTLRWSSVRSPGVNVCVYGPDPDVDTAPKQA